MTKATENGEDQFLGLLVYRNTPVDGFASPAQLLMSRQLRSILPCTTHHLKKKVVPTKQFTQQRTEMQKRQKFYHDKSAKALNQLNPGDAIHIQKMPNGPWKQAVVVSHAKQPRSYRVQTNEGTILRRNRKHLSARPHQSPKGTSLVREGLDDAIVPDATAKPPPSPLQADQFMSPLPIQDRNQILSPCQSATVVPPLESSATPTTACTRYCRLVRKPLKLNL